MSMKPKVISDCDQKMFSVTTGTLLSVCGSCERDCKPTQGVDIIVNLHKGWTSL